MPRSYMRNFLWSTFLAWGAGSKEAPQNQYRDKRPVDSGGTQWQRYLSAGGAGGPGGPGGGGGKGGKCHLPTVR